MKLLLALVFMNTLGFTSQTLAQVQNHGDLLKLGESFLRAQNSKHDGQINVVMGQIDARLNLTACDDPTVFLPQGGKINGKTTLGIRCNSPKRWNIFVAAQVQLIGDFLVAATPLAQGHVVTESDIKKVSGDIMGLAAGSVTNQEYVIGKTLQQSVPAGTTFKTTGLKSALAIQQGQMVKVVAIGKSFNVSTDGQAIGNAAEGQVTKAKTTSGQLVTGIAKAGGVLEVQY
jgi:flagellar basal body P-ring formation protein FlgA